MGLSALCDAYEQPVKSGGEYSHLAIDLSPPVRDTLDGLAATQSDTLRDLSWKLIKDTDE